MKRTKFIMLALVVALVLMGAGYAAWTQVFQINSTVTTGELRVDAVAGEVNKFEIKHSNAATGYTLATIQEYANVGVTGVTEATRSNVASLYDLHNSTTLDEPATGITFKLPNMFPGTQVVNTVKFTNNGNMGVVAAVKDGAATSAGDLQLFYDMIITVSDGTITRTVDASYVSAEDKCGALEDAIAEVIDDIAVGGNKTITFTQNLPITSGNDNNDTESKSLEWTVPVSFQQYNVQ